MTCWLNSVLLIGPAVPGTQPSVVHLAEFIPLGLLGQGFTSNPIIQAVHSKSNSHKTQSRGVCMGYVSGAIFQAGNVDSDQRQIVVALEQEVMTSSENRVGAWGLSTDRTTRLQNCFVALNSKCDWHPLCGGFSLRSA